MVHRLSYAEKGAGPHRHEVLEIPLLFHPFVSSCLRGYKSIMQNKPNLQQTEMNVNFCDKRDYENKSAFGVQRKQSQIKANFKRANTLLRLPDETLPRPCGPCKDEFE